MEQNDRVILTEKQLNLEVELIVNKQLFKNNIIDKATYETVSDDILKEIQKELKDKE